MKTLSAVLTLVLAVPVSSLHAAYQSMPLRGQQVTFEATIISDDEGLKSEHLRGGRPFVAARSGERYAVRLTNPLPVRVAVNLTVDGLNSITGKPSGISDGMKWMIEPYGTITIRGWQVNGEESRRFFFTPKPASYAAWRGLRLGRDLSANCGVIGAAFFWSQRELDDYYASRQQVRDARLFMEKDSMGALPSAQADAPAAAKRIKAGTGMGEREAHPTQSVEFHYDQGMYRASQAVVIYYDFAQTPQPNPFPDVRFAPEM